LPLLHFRHDHRKKATDSPAILPIEQPEGIIAMHSEGKIWLIAGLGLAVALTGLIARVYRGLDTPPSAASIFDPLETMESVRFSQRQHSVLAQPTILQADAAVIPLGRDSVDSPLREPLPSPIVPLTLDDEPSGSEPASLLSPAVYDDIPLVPPPPAVQQP
jgi:hypothetical protein